MQIKTTMTYHFILVRTVIIQKREKKKKKKDKHWQECRGTGTIIYAVGKDAK